MRKSERHDAVRARALRAIEDMYHNATLPSHGWPDTDESDPDCNSDAFDSWLSEEASAEIDYLSEGPYGRNYRATLEHPVNTGRFKSEKARRFYVAKELRDMAADQERNAWERISEFGRLYQYGRGGRTVAPNSLWRDGGSGHGPKRDAIEGMSQASLVELALIVESFNRVVRDWCESVPGNWRETCETRKSERFDAEARDLEASRPDMYPEQRNPA